ncbi:hypothetical protein RINTHM_7430 [Richelia intracellularis HM01]|nr:hypothetical protein RINTHM_7430 [Richelia intracellularis HM01]
MAKRGMAINAARYGAARSIFALIGPIMWTWFLPTWGGDQSQPIIVVLYPRYLLWLKSALPILNLGKLPK